MSRVLTGSAKHTLSFSRYFPTLGQNWRVAVKYSLGCLLAALGIGSIFFLNGGKAVSMLVVPAVCTGFAGLGLFHAFYWRRALPATDGVAADRITTPRIRPDRVTRRAGIAGGHQPVSSLVSAEGWHFTTALCLVVAGSLFTLYQLTDRADPVWALIATFLFLLPFTVIQSWFTLAAIPEKKYKIWYNPIQLPEQVSKHGDLFLRIRIARNYFDIHDTILSMTGRARVRLGMLFCSFIAEENAVGGPGIECADENNELYGWEFYRSRLRGIIKTHLDPDLTLGQNKIKSNDIIIAKRVKKYETGKL